MMPNPTSLLGGKAELPEVEQLGTITLETLNLYHCLNPDRRCLSLFGKVYDVTSGVTSYGPDGAYKEYAGHDFTLSIGAHVTGDKWLDRFVKLDNKMTKGAKQWEEYYDEKYPVCGRLDKWDEDYEKWPELTEEEAEALSKGCTIM
jgi:hypothetical protein